MPTATRTLLATACFALAAAVACGGGSPTAPSGATGATVAGTVHVNGAAAFAPGTNSVSSGMTVSVVGTNLSATVERSGFFQIPDVPAGTVQLQFTDATVNATAALSNVRQQELIEIEVEVAGTSATITSELRSTEKVSLCHNTGTDEYHLISVSASAEPAHRAHGDGKIGDPVPGGETNQTFGENCRVVGPSVRIEKSTNGQDADSAPGPTIEVGSTVTWQYVVTNTGTVDLTSVTVVDDRGVAVSCPGTTLTAGQSMTCTGSGVAVLGQYRNLGTVTASWTSGTVTDSDPSHYYGRAPEDDEDTAKVQLCHKTGNGSYHLIEVSVSAEPAHRAHGDAKIGEPVPGMPGKVFGVACSVN